MDIADHAEKDTELLLQMRIQSVRQKNKMQPAPTGVCRFCGDSIDEGGFCDPICRKKFELSQRS